MLLLGRLFLPVRFFIYGLSLVSLCIASSLIFIDHTHADSPVGLTISPLRTEFVITPGTVMGGNVTVYNNTIQDMTVNMSAEGFGVKNIQYDYSFDPGSLIVDWTRFMTSVFTLLPGKSQTVSYTISAPIGAEPRGRYVSLFATTSLQSTGGGFESQERVGSLLYITIAGDVTQLGNLLSLNTPWIAGGPTTWTATIQNTGTTHFRTNYTLNVKTLWGSSVSTTSNNTLILPSSVRLVQGSIPQLTLPGIYKLVYDMTMGNAPAVHVTHYILYMPVYGLIVIAVILFYIAILISRYVVKKRESKQQID